MVQETSVTDGLLRQPITRREDARELLPEEKLSLLDQQIIGEVLDNILVNAVIQEYIGDEEHIDVFRTAIIEDAVIGGKRFLDLVRWYNGRFPGNRIPIPSDKYRSRTVGDMMANPLQKSEIIIGDEGNTLLTKGARGCIYGPPKAAKTCLAIQCGVDLACGGTFLGRYKVSNPQNVLYLNFELDEALFEERVLQVKNTLGYEDIASFKQLTLLGKDIPLLDIQDGYKQFHDIIDIQRSDGFQVEVLILDCRWKTFCRSDNEGEVMRSWLANMESLQNEFHFIPIIIHHEGKATTGMGAGSSNFDRWINTAIQIQVEKGTSTRKIMFYGNYTDRFEIVARLDYPIYKLTNVEVWGNRQSKKEKAAEYILTTITENGEQVEQQELQELAIQNGITEDAFKRALNYLERDQKITKRQDTTKPGRHNIIELKGEEDSPHP